MSLLQIQDLSFTYTGQTKPTVLIPKFEIQKGAKVFIHGSSGSGKTTFLEILAGVLPIDSGKIQILEQDFSKLSASARDRFRADHIGYIFQSFNLIPYLSVLENITLPLFLSDRRQSNYHESELQEMLQVLGIEQLQNRKVTELSIGQQQRVAVARALLGKPEIILADEPTSSLDYDHREKFLKVLFQTAEKSGSTILFVSHDRTMEKLFDQVVSFAQLNQAGSL